MRMDFYFFGFCYFDFFFSIVICWKVWYEVESGEEVKGGKGYLSEVGSSSEFVRIEVLRVEDW